jgi:Porin PorA
MRKWAGALLIGLGVFLVFAAPLARYYLAPSIVRIPIDQESSSESEATGATYLERATASLKFNQTIRATREVRGDVKDGTEDRAVWDVYLTVTNADTGALIDASTDRVALDRRSGEAVRCCEETVDGEPVEHEGLTYTFPFGTEKKSYDYFDNSIGETRPMRYLGTAEIRGLEVYRFRQVVEETVVDSLDVPGSLVGQPNTPTVKADVVYSTTRTVWVEPASGVIVRGQQQQKQTLRAEGSPQDTVVLDALFRFTDETVDGGLESAREARSSIMLLTVVGPITSLILGVVLILIGLAVVRRGKPKRTAAAKVDTEKKPASAAT